MEKNHYKERTLKILMLAYECNPNWPSLPVVAYKYALAMGEEVEVTLVTQVLNKENIDKAGHGKVNFDFIDVDFISKPFDRFGKFIRGGNSLGWTTQVIFTYPGYLAFEMAVWFKYRKQIKSGEFAVVHRQTPMTQTLPSFIAGRTKNFIIGPLNGGLPWPPQFKSMGSREKEWFRPLRNLAKFMPFYQSTYRKAACILASFKHTIEDLPKHCQEKIIDFPEVGLDPKIFSRQDKEIQVSKPITVIFVGRLVPLKLPEVVLNAFANSTILQQHKLVYVGDGPMRPELEKIVEEKNLHHCVSVKGWMAQSEVGQLMNESDIFVFPSVKDLGAGVLVEAMASGLACIGLDYGAASTIINEERGLKVPLGSREEITASYQTAMENLVEKPDELVAIRKKAREFALENFTWAAKVKKTIEIYKWLKEDGDIKTRPKFW